MTTRRDKPFRSVLPTSVSSAPGPHTHAGTDITSALIAQARLGTGSAGAGAKFLADDQTYKTPSGGAPSGAAGGALAGTYPNPTLASADLAAIAALTPTNDDIVQRKAGAWVNRTLTQLKVDLALVVANISDFVSAVASAITTERTAVRTLTNVTLTAPVVNSPTGIVKGDVGLGNVDNTSDANKPVSTATQTALNLKANLASPTFTGTVGGITAAMVGAQPLDADLTTIASLTATTNNFMVAAASAWASVTPAAAKTALSLVKGDVGLGSVDNTADAAKAVLTATKWATGRTLALTGDVAYTSPSFDGSGNVTAAATLANTAVTPGTYGASSAIPVVTVDAKGRVTAVTTQSPAVTRPVGFKFNLLATSGVFTDPGSGNARFYTGGGTLYLNYTDSDAKNRATYLVDAMGAYTGNVMVVLTNGTTATEMAHSSSPSDNGTWAEFGLNTVMDPSVFTSGQPVYVVITPSP